MLRRIFLRRGPRRKAPWKTPSTPQPPMFAAPLRAAGGRLPTDAPPQLRNQPFHLRLCLVLPHTPPPDRRRSGPRRQPGRALPRRAPTGYIRARTTRTARRISHPPQRSCSVSCAPPSLRSIQYGNAILRNPCRRRRFLSSKPCMSVRTKTMRNPPARSPNAKTRRPGERAQTNSSKPNGIDGLCSICESGFLMRQ